MTPKAERYLRWGHGTGLLDAFEKFVEPGTGSGSVAAGEHLLRRLRAVEQGDVQPMTLDILEVAWLKLQNAAPQVRYDKASRMFALACWGAMLQAPLEVLPRAMRLLTPYLPPRQGLGPPPAPGGEAPAPGATSGPSAERSFVRFRVPKVPVVGPDGKPPSKTDGTPQVRDRVYYLREDVLARLRRDGITRVAIESSDAPGGKVEVDLFASADPSTDAPKTLSESPPAGPATRQPPAREPADDDLRERWKYAAKSAEFERMHQFDDWATGLLGSLGPAVPSTSPDDGPEQGLRGAIDPASGLKVSSVREAARGERDTKGASIRHRSRAGHLGGSALKNRKRRRSMTGRRGERHR